MFLFSGIIKAQVWQPNLGNGKYKNPIIYADYSDPDVIRVDENYYMVASSFTCMPGIPILQSKNLVNWKIIGHVYDSLPLQKYEKPQHGEGSWAPSIRYHNGLFYVYFCTPNDGLFVGTAKKITGPWQLTMVEDVADWEDPCPFWDDDGNAYLVHSKVCANILYLNKLSKDGKQLLDNGTIIYHNEKKEPTIEGPKMMKRNGYYYILSPAGGVGHGWQAVLRAKHIYGPYQAKDILHQGDTDINGPHQGGLVETQSGEWWFLHFQDKGPYGRIVRLEPAGWKDNWPYFGVDKNGDGIGEPVTGYKMPDVGKNAPAITPQTSDDFSEEKLGLQWQWMANPQKRWYSLTQHPGFMRLYAIKNFTQKGNLYFVPNLLLQKFPAPEFQVTTKMTFHPDLKNEKAGLVVMGKKWSFLSLINSSGGLKIGRFAGERNHCYDPTQISDSVSSSSNTLYLRVTVRDSAFCQYSYSLDGKTFKDIGHKVQADSGVWIGAKVGIFCINPNIHQSKGYADFDFVHVSKIGK